jgi:hypothetical protein
VTENSLLKIEKFKPQSGPEGTTVMEGSTLSTEQNILFRDQNPSYVYGVDYVDDPTRGIQDTDDATLDNFFSRPLKISTQEWGTGTTLGYDFDPWELYFGNPRVINRMTNYNLMRAKLRLKIVINGNGFQYGRAMVGYLPMDSYDKMSIFASLIPQDLVQLSQCPHVFVDPTTSTGGELCLPYFNHLNNSSIPFGNYRNLGRIYVRTINALKHANGAGDKCTVSIFAWAEDVQLNVLTSVDAPTLTPQFNGSFNNNSDIAGAEDVTPQSGMESKGKKNTMSKSTQGGKKSSYARQDGGAATAGKEIDEANSTGMVSGPATSIVKAANALSVIPQIAPFAMATSKVVGAVGNAAKALGYSRPPITKNPEPYRPTPASQLATTNTPDTAIKLTVDEKQELTIDPGIAGLGPEDPMSIQNIASRESYLTKFNWDMGTAPETLLWNARVDPVQWVNSGGSKPAYHFPATAMAALPFEYWTGTLKFRFQIVCSAFHKGRLKFVYDPLFLDTNEYNTNYIEIVDIADTQDFTIEIGNGQATTLLQHALPGEDPVSDQHNVLPLTYKPYGNGVIGVYIVNELTTPNSSVDNNIEVNVYISAGDDFEVFVPDDHFQKFVFKPQSGIEPQSGNEIVPESQDTEEPSAPEQSMSDILGPGIQNTQQINKVFAGETIVSFRTLLKRYNLWRREKTTAGGTTNFTRMSTTKSMFPFYRGNVSGAVDMRYLNTPYNFVNTVMLHWVVAAFSGWRGSIRYKLMFDKCYQDTAQNHSSRVYISREGVYPPGVASYTRDLTPYGSLTNDSRVSSFVMAGNMSTTGVNGMLYATDSINSTVEFEVPYYSQYRFTPGKLIDYTSANLTGNWSPNWRMEVNLLSSGISSVDYHVAAGEDFQVYFFTGLPRMYYEAIPPSP